MKELGQEEEDAAGEDGEDEVDHAREEGRLGG